MFTNNNSINNSSLIFPCVAEHDDNMIIASGQNFTIEFWFYGSSISSGVSGNQTIFSKGISGNFLENGGSDYSLFYNNSSLNFYTYNISSGSPLLSAKNIITGRWYHAAIVKNSNISKIYINGIESSSNSSGWAANGTGDFYLATNFFDPNNSNYIFNGFIDSFKFTKAAKYENNFSISRPINDNFINEPINIDKHFDKNILSLEMNSFHGDTKIVDSSINNFSLINSGVIISSEKSKFGSSSAFFKGQTAYLTIPNNIDFHIFSGDFTVEAWINPNTVDGVKYILKHNHDTQNGGWGIGLTGNRPFFTYGLGGTDITLISKYQFVLNSWQQIAVSRNGDNLYLITNGVIDTYRKMNEVPISGTSPLYIGTDSGSPSRTWNGYIDNIIITKDVGKYIPEFDIQNLEFLRTQSSDPHFNNVSLLMYGNGTSGSSFFTDESRYGISRLGDGCGYFSGFSFITTPFSGIGNLGSDNFTIDIWIKPMQLPASGSVMGIINKIPAFEEGGYWSGLKNTSNFLPSASDPYLKDFNLRISNDLGNQSTSSPVFASRWDAFNKSVRNPGQEATYYWLKGTNSLDLMQLFQSPSTYYSRANWPNISATYFNEYDPPYNSSWRLYISGVSDNEHRVCFAYKNSGIFKSSSSPAKINLYEWNHIAIVRTGSQIISYVNGVSGEALIENNIIPNSISPLRIGRYNNVSANYYYNGFIEDTRITKNISRYNSNFSGNLPAAFGNNSGEDVYYNNIELLLHLNGLHNSSYIKDNSINNYIIVTGNGVLIKLNNDIITNGTSISNSSVQSVFGGASIRGVGGSTSSLQIPSRYDFANFNTGDFTIEWWDNISSWNNGYFPVLHYGNDGDYDAAKSRIGIYYASSGTQLVVSMSGNSQIFPVLFSGYRGYEMNAWKHNAITRKNGMVNLFIDGIKHPSGFLMDYNISRGVNISTIGAGKYGASLGTLYTMSGYIDDLRVTKNIARYTDDFIPPTEQFANF